MTRHQPTLRVLLVDDHPVVRRGLGTCLTRHPRIELVGEAADGEEALALAAQLRPDVVVTDVEMPRMDGATFTTQLLENFPNVRVLVLTVHGQSNYVLRMMQAGASGYLLKDAEPEALARGIEAVARGESVFSPDLAQHTLNQVVRAGPAGQNPLTPREREVLIRIAEGLSNKQIAAQLQLGIRTVETHRERAMKKLHIHSIAGLTKYALAQGWVSLESESAAAVG
ncbi:MAG: response regulator [Limisphaerales bacterium]|jgi:DNA-binding NarL/FixJ family response regulator